MSRIGRRPIDVPAGVEVVVETGRVSVSGPRGSLQESFSPDITVEKGEGSLTVSRPTDRPEHRALHGLVRTLVANMVTGVTSGFEKRLEIQGVGYRANLRGSDIEFALGYSHTITVKPPKGIEFEVPTPTAVVVKGISRQQVGQVAAEIRYEGEYVQRKVGKRA
jgi:large subunit ribosomal protein L6